MKTIFYILATAAILFLASESTLADHFPQHQEWRIPVTQTYVDANNITHTATVMELHRLGNRPAVIGADGLRKYYVNGELHRTNGPAITGPTSPRFFVRGQEMSAKDYYEVYP